MNLDDKHIMYFRSMGKLLRITAIFTDIDECNRHCEKSNDAVIAESGKFIFCADKGDKGSNIAHDNMRSLIDGAMEIVELYKPTTPAQIVWKSNWLKQARHILLSLQQN